MDSPSRKRKAISLKTKYQIILAVDEGKKAKKDIGSEFGILPNSLSTILKNRDAILKHFDSSFLLENSIVLEHIRNLKKLYLSGFRKNMLKMFRYQVLC